MMLTVCTKRLACSLALGVMSAWSMAQAPPVFGPQTPCNQTLNASVGIPFSYPVVASVSGGNAIGLFTAGLPAGATHNPPLPLSVFGPNPTVNSTFNWMPTSADVGLHSVLYAATNKINQQVFCQVDIQVSQPAGAQPPVFLPPSPCNQNLQATVGLPFSFVISAAVPGGNALGLFSGPLPSGASQNPPLPLQPFGPNPMASSTFNWTPDAGDVGSHQISYAAVNKLGQQTFCQVTVTVNQPQGPLVPVFLPPTPCGQTLAATAGVPFSFDVSAVVPGGNGVSLFVNQLPAGATHTPVLPQTVFGPSPTVTSTFNWTPAESAVGSHQILYAAVNELGQQITCQVTVVVAECFLIAGTSIEWFAFPGNPSDILLVHPSQWWPVTMETMPPLQFPNNPSLQGTHIYFQVLMWNPQVFPTNVLQLTDAVDVELGGSITHYGPTSGMNIYGQWVFDWLDLSFQIQGF